MNRFSSMAWGGLAVCLALVAMAAISAIAPSGRADDAPKPANFTQKIEGSSVAFDMIAIPGGKFKMGTPDSEAGRKDDEGPQHEVELAPFHMGKTEVTWDEFDQYWKVEGQPMARPDETDARKADAITRPTPPYADETFGHGREGNPVICITHHTAMEYCRWLSRKTGRWYRLPTEAEWEYACRAGTASAYSYGDDASQLGEYAWFAGNAEELAHPVGKKKANPWGLHDMHGNACEWCLDHYEKDIYTKLAGKLSLRPVVLPTEKRFSHVARGGSWADPAPMLRSGARRGSDKTWIKLDPQRPQSIWWLTSAEFVGFRVVSPVKEQPELVDLRSKVTRQSQ